MLSACAALVAVLLTSGSESAPAPAACPGAGELAVLSAESTAFDALEARARELAAPCAASAEYHAWWGDALRLAGKLDEAEKELRQASRLAPSSPQPLAGLALVARDRGRSDEAEAYSEAALALGGTPEESAALEAVLAPPQKESAQYAFKDADGLADGLRIGAKSIRPKAVATDYRKDYFIGAKGFGANLDILFEVSSSRLLPQGEHQLDQLGTALRRAGTTEKYLIEGHSSSEGAAGFNLGLSQQRAAAVVDYLAARHGVRVAMLEPVGRGTAYPVVVNGAENREKSRRVTVLRLYDE